MTYPSQSGPVWPELGRGGEAEGTGMARQGQAIKDLNCHLKDLGFYPITRGSHYRVDFVFVLFL